MRLAILSDIHANLVALEAVLRDAAGRAVEGVLHLGDVVGYGPDPNGVVARLQAEEIAGVVGNYDLAVLADDETEGRTRFLKQDLSVVGERVYRWTREHLDERSRAFLAALPAQLRLCEGDRVFLLTHGSPERPNEYLRADTPDRRLEELFERASADVLLVGHTHLALAREVGAGLLLNPGSVGQPKDGDPRASYLILDTTHGLSAEHVRVEFDVETVARQSIDSRLPPEQAEALRRGRGA